MGVLDLISFDNFWDLIPESIFERMHPCPITGHVFWEGKWNTGNGYSKVRYNGKIWVVHKLVHYFVYGPTDLPIHDHVCKFRPCIHPDHMEPVTVQENTRRGGAVLYRPTNQYPRYRLGLDVA